MSSNNATELLITLRKGDRKVVDRLFVLVQEDLKKIARKHLRGERKGHTLDTTALVNESYLNLIDQSAINVEDKAHFLALASRAMRHILIDYARKRNALKRGAGQIHLSIEDHQLKTQDPIEILLTVDAALKKLAAIDERMSDVVECRYFGGMTMEETAEALSLSKRTVERSWTKAKAYLKQSFL